METKERIVELLKSTNRSGIESLIKYLESEGFFEDPASPKGFHGSYAGGLANHSLRVYEMLVFYVTKYKPHIKSGFGQLQYMFDDQTLIIPGLLHDVCKIGAYVRTKADDGWTNNRAKEKGHAKLSISRIKKFIKLEKLEELMIRYHMGLYGAVEFCKEGDTQHGEYPLRGDHSKDEHLTKEESQKKRYGKSLANAWYHNPIVKLMYFCDELATFEARAKENGNAK